VFAMDYYPRQKAEAEFMELTKDMKCGKQWLQSQQVYCQKPKGHDGMHESEYESDSGEEGDLWWSGEDLPSQGEEHETNDV
jgi:hypothetical protein